MNAQRVELLRALESDFIETRDRVAAETAVATDLRDRAEAFMAAAGDRLSLDPDSIRFLSEAIVSGVGFFAPSVVSYDAARTSGEISLIESGALLEAFADFDRTLEDMERKLDGTFVPLLVPVEPEKGSLSAIDLVEDRDLGKYIL